MLLLFPGILFLAPFAITLIRVAVGITFVLIAWDHYQRRAKLADVTFIIIGRGMWIPIFAAIIEITTGIALIFGAYTQVAAIVGAILAIKSFIWKNRYSTFFRLPRSTSALLFIMSLSLIVIGAGAIAFDLPL